MFNLPQSSELPLVHLMRIFSNTSASYKYLLFGSLLHHIETSRNRIVPFSELALKAMSFAWYSIHFYKLNFGISDRMTLWVRELDHAFNDRLLVSELSMFKIHQALQAIQFEGDPIVQKALDRYIKEFGALVPFRLISPWFQKDLKNIADAKRNKLIATLSHDSRYCSLYKIHLEPVLTIELNEAWYEYLYTHLGIIQGWWKFHLIEYLQKKNPTVLSIATKLQPPNERHMSDVKRLFKNYFQYTKKIPMCFYTDKKLEVISHDHFLPWSFLGSDPIYNFVPTSKDLNSSKGNQIPSPEYLPKLGSFQYQVFNYLRAKEPRNRLIESYVNDFHLDPSANQDEFCQKLERLYGPLFTSAKNQGFADMWRK